MTLRGMIAGAGGFSGILQAGGKGGDTKGCDNSGGVLPYHSQSGTST